MLLSAEDYDSMVETLDILSDASLVAAIRESEASMDRGEVFTADDVESEMGRRGRLPK